MRLRDIGEDALVDRLVGLVKTGIGAEGPGDDCAVVDSGGDELVLLKTDALVEGVHFLQDADPEQVGWKAVARVVSDFAAMGGRGEWYLITLALPGEMEVAWVEGVYRGIGRCLKRYGGILSGGETCRVPDGSAAVISVAATGKVARGKVVTRGGGAVGDELWVTGELGGSIKGKHLNFLPRVEEARWLVENFEITAMMDLSDGLAKDLPRMARASSCGYDLNFKALPVSEGSDVNGALQDGEDFELLFSVKGSDGLLESWEARFPGLSLTRIGGFVADGEGCGLSGGWDHFD